MSKNLKKLAACGARPPIQYELIKRDTNSSEMMRRGKEQGTYMVDTIMVGITRSGMISKTTRTNNQAVGLHKERGRRMYRRARTNIKTVETRTYNTRLSVHARIVVVLPAHYGARSKMRALSKNPVQSHHQNQPNVPN